MKFNLFFLSLIVLTLSSMKPSNLSLQKLAHNQTEQFDYFDSKLIKKPRTENAGSFSSWITKNIHLSDEQLKLMGESNKVTVRFVITADGNLTEPKIAFGVGNVADEEAIRLVKSCLEKWLPGETKNERVATIMYYQIDFKNHTHAIVNAKNEHQKLTVKF